MAKETFYFSHDYEPTSDIKISAMVGEFGAIGYGIYWRVVELLHSEPTHKLPQRKYVYSAIAKQFLIDVEQVSSLVDFCITECFLFEQDEDKNYFWSNRVLRNFDKRAEISESRSYAGKVSAEKRKQAKEANLLEINKNNPTLVEQISTLVEQNPTPVEQNLTNGNKEKKRKEKEIKNININIDFDIFWDLYDKKVGDKVKLKKKWDSLTDKERETAITHIPLYKKSKPDKQFRKDPQTYLNNKSFNDEIIGIRDAVVPIQPIKSQQIEWWKMKYGDRFETKEEFEEAYQKGIIDPFND